MADLVLDMALLETLDARLATVLHSLEHAESIAHSTGAACGHKGLRDKVEDFADDWDDNRESLLDSVREITKMVNAVTTGFRDMDSELRTALMNGMQGAS